jgi:fermentation-respiration switch protein FrsA (DUF1100 family)
MSAVTCTSVRFDSNGKSLAGTLRHGDRSAPGVIVTGSWLTVKEQMADLYADRLAACGFTTLTFDFANFGESEGDPRQFEDPTTKIADIAAAARFLASRSETNAGGVGGLAVCASAQYMACAISHLAPIAAFVTVAAWIHDAASLPAVYGGPEGVKTKIEAGEQALKAYRETGQVATVPAYSDTDPDAAMGEMVKAYYGDPAVGAPPEWVNAMAVMSWPGWLGFDGMAAADRVGVPTLMIHSDECAFPENAKAFATRSGATLSWREGGQIDFYHRPDLVDPAVASAADHFARNMAVPS